MKFRNLALSAATLLFCAAGAFAQTSSLEGDVFGEDGAPLIGAMVKIDRTDIKGAYKVKTDKKGHYFHAGLPLGTYNISVEVDGKVKDNVKNVRTRLGDPTPVNFNLKKLADMSKAKQAATQKLAEGGKMTKEQERGMSSEEKAALEKAAKDRSEVMKKNKELNDAFGGGMEALKNKQYDVAVQQFEKANAMDATQQVIWAQLAEAYMGLGASKTGPDQQAAYEKGLEAYVKAIALKGDDASYINNYALALAKAKKFPEAQAQLSKAAQIDPTNAGRYFYNLGALLVNRGQNDPAGEAFKKAIEADPNYADAQYQYGIYLIAKAQIASDGKITPVPGTQEAFQKYLALKPDGPMAETAKSMLTSMGATIDTSYKNPATMAAEAAKKAKAAKTKKK